MAAAPPPGDPPQGDPPVLDDVFLWKKAEKLGDSFLKLGIALGLTAAEVKQIKYDERDAVPINFNILLTWRNRSTHQDSPSEMMKELKDALSGIGRDDLMAPGKYQ